MVLIVTSQTIHVNSYLLYLVFCSGVEMCSTKRNRLDMPLVFLPFLFLVRTQWYKYTVTLVLKFSCNIGSAQASLSITFNVILFLLRWVNNDPAKIHVKVRR